ncbi:MAG: hypothetical protein V1787_05515 [Candidatus Micrarchaeota archaeon]
MASFYGYNPKAMLLYLIAAYFVANGIYFVVKGYMYQNAGFGYVWATFQFFVGVVSIMFAKAFKSYGCSTEQAEKAPRRRR